MAPRAFIFSKYALFLCLVLPNTRWSNNLSKFLEQRLVNQLTSDNKKITSENGIKSSSIKESPTQNKLPQTKKADCATADLFRSSKK